jgi:branched-chain amino acid transport system permease protein
MDVMAPLIGSLIGAFILGSIYSLIAMGLSMLWSTLGLANFAHGAVLVTGAYIAWYLSSITGSVYAAVLVIPLLFALGLAVNRAIFRRISTEPDAPLRLVLVTLALAVLWEQVLNLVFGGVRKHVPTFVEGSLQLGDTMVLNQHLLAFAVAVLSLVILYFFMARTIPGLAIRALGQSIQESLVVGVNVERMYSITVGIGFSLAGIAGMLLGSMYVFNASFGRTPLFIGYIIVVLGGVGNLKGTIYASYLVAVIEALTVLFLGGSWRIAAPFLLMIFVLLIRPSGLFGIREEVG